MKKRLFSAALGLVILAVVTLLYYTPVLLGIVGVILALALYEIYRSFGSHCLPILIGEYLICALMLFSNEELVQNYIFIAFFAFALLVVVCLIFDSERYHVKEIGGMLTYSAMVICCFYSFLFFRFEMADLPNRYDAVFFTYLAMWIAWGADVAAYVVGSKFGKRKLAPTISPNKTVEGAIGGMFGSFIFAIAVTLLYTGIVSLLNFETAIVFNISFVLILLPICFIGAILSIMGDLFASVIKRQCHIKDFGKLIPGHGGIMDRFDSLLLVTPLFVIILKLPIYNVI